MTVAQPGAVLQSGQRRDESRGRWRRGI